MATVKAQAKRQHQAHGGVQRHHPVPGDILAPLGASSRKSLPVVKHGSGEQVHVLRGSANPSVPQQADPNRRPEGRR